MNETRQFPSSAKLYPPRTWLIINIGLVIICMLALSYGFYKATLSDYILHFSDFIMYVINSAAFTLASGVLRLVSIVQGLGMIIIPIIAIILYINAGYAIYFCAKHHSQFPKYTIVNLICAVVPPLFCTIITIFTF